MPVNFLSSKDVGFRHGFFTREGGVSKDQFESLNATARVGDTDENVATNRKRALAALKLKPENLAFLDHLEHSNRILSVSEAARGLDFDGYDAIITNVGGVILGISSADCAIIMLASEKEGVIGLVHSGWRGTRAFAVAKAIQAMVEEYRINPAHLRAVIGPAISSQSYEIGHDVAKEFDDRYLRRVKDKTYLDLGLAIEDQLIESGVKQIENLTVNTYTDERFFSYRRDNGDTGRNLTVATL